jgi:hypothetical protein
MPGISLPLIASVTALMGFALTNQSSFATSRSGSQPAVQAVRSCDPASFGRVLSLREAQLRRVRREGLSPEGGEGNTIEVYYEGSRPRIVKIVDLGETGRAESKFFLADTSNFVLWRSVHEYRNPISPQQSAQIARTTRTASFYCGGRSLDAADSVGAAAADRLRAVLAETRR